MRGGLGSAPLVVGRLAPIGTVGDGFALAGADEAGAPSSEDVDSSCAVTEPRQSSSASVAAAKTAIADLKAVLITPPRRNARTGVSGVIRNSVMFLRRGRGTGFALMAAVSPDPF